MDIGRTMFKNTEHFTLLSQFSTESFKFNSKVLFSCISFNQNKMYICLINGVIRSYK